MRALSVGVLSGFCNILDNVKSHIVKTTIKILSQTPIMNLSLHFLCLALSTCLSKLSSLKCVDSVTNAVICKLHPTGYKMNAVLTLHFDSGATQSLSTMLSENCMPPFRLVDQHSPHDRYHQHNYL